MTRRPLSAEKKVGLFSAPWPLYNRPSIQLGALKAYVKRRFPSLAAEAHHLYLSIAESVGYDTYQAISKKSWVAESVYAALLFPERAATVSTLFKKQGSPLIRSTDFHALTARVKKASDGLIAGINWQQFGLVGFSVSLCQLTSTLYFIRRIKALNPALMVVVGGSSLSGLSSPGLFTHFPEIDMVVTGEGESAPWAGSSQALPLIRKPRPPGPSRVSSPPRPRQAAIRPVSARSKN
jgi:hypothetical protein